MTRAAAAPNKGLHFFFSWSSFRPRFYFINIAGRRSQRTAQLNHHALSDGPRETVCPPGCCKFRQTLVLSSRKLRARARHDSTEPHPTIRN